mgnify:CR=1 FL=1
MTRTFLQQSLIADAMVGFNSRLKVQNLPKSSWFVEFDGWSQQVIFETHHQIGNSTADESFSLFLLVAKGLPRMAWRRWRLSTTPNVIFD